MISTGNDIIALNIIDVCRTMQERFYSKILSSTEVEEYFRDHALTISFERYIWLLWSIKESVFKFCKRHSPNLAFSPKKIICGRVEAPLAACLLLPADGEIEDNSLPDAGNCWCSVAHTDTGVYYSRSIVLKDIIYTVVNDTNYFHNTWWGVKHIDSACNTCQSESVRAFTMRKLKDIYPVDTRLAFGKHAVGYPILKVSDADAALPISFTHHDRYVAYSFVYDTENKRIPAATSG